MTQTTKSGPDPIDVEVGLTIRRLRKAAHMSQSSLADALGVTFQQIQKYERGANRISASMMVRAAEAFGVQPGDLMPHADAPRAPAYIKRFADVRGADEVVELYAGLSSRRRRAVLQLLRAIGAGGDGAGPPDDID